MTRARHRSLPVAALFCLEVIALAAAYQSLNLVECAGTDAYGACRFLRSLAARALTIFAAAALFAVARPDAMTRLAAHAADHPGARRWAVAHVAGVALLALPLFFSAGGDLTAEFGFAALFLVSGSTLAGVGGLLWLAPPRAWVALAREAPVVLPLALAIAFLLPDLADLARPLWDVQGLTFLTFRAVRAVLSLFTPATYVDEEAYILGVDGFAVQIARQCSGIEGFALVSGFVAIYGGLFRDTVRTGRFLAVVLPLGLALSWGLNVIRIAALILIGAHVSPDLAVNGFHSYAGWLFFLLLALGLLYATHAVSWFQREPSQVPPARTDGPRALRLREDRLAAFILPFVAFMGGSVAAGAFFPHPDLGYPLKAAVMAAALYYWLPVFRGFDWRPDPVALAAGVSVGVFWIAAVPGGEGGAALVAALADLGPWALAAWAVVRIFGTVALIPVIEESFFRGYVLARIDGLDGGGIVARIAAVAVSTFLFAALHGRWIAAGVAGLVFSLVMIRRGRLTDAIWAHAAANLTVAVWAAIRGDWSII